MALSGLVSDPRFLQHEPGQGHPERPERLMALIARLEQSGLRAQMDECAAKPASLETIERVHAAGHAERIDRAAAAGEDVVDSPDANLSMKTYDVARLAAGGALTAVERVMSGDWKNAFVAARPPGHHAEENLAMGFCFFNSAAIAARALQAEHGIERVAIVDWDVHHGNGTQHLFDKDPSVFYASLHQYPHYPGTGAESERGRGDGEGTTLNCPLSAGTGDHEWLDAFEEKLLPAVDAFAPQFVLISAGFDAHRRDPLSSTLVGEETYGRMTELLLGVADSHAEGRVVSLLEGGYDLEGLSASAEEHVAALLR